MYNTEAHRLHTQHIDTQIPNYLCLLLRGPVIHDHNEQNQQCALFIPSVKPNRGEIRGS